MVIVCEDVVSRTLKNGETKKGFYLNATLKQNLDDLKLAVENNWDGIGFIDGMEGAAKTTLALAICKYLYPAFSNKNIVFTQDEFYRAVDNAAPGTAILWDEFVMGGLSTEATTSNQNALIKKLTVIRKKRLYIMLVLPYFFMSRLYFAVSRSRFLIHVYSPDGISRGSFLFFSYKRKKELYFKGRKFYDYGVCQANFKGDFVDTFDLLVDREEYDNRKDRTIANIQAGVTKADGTPRARARMRQLDNANRRMLIELFEVTRATSAKFLKKRYPWLPFTDRRIQDVLKLDKASLEKQISKDEAIRITGQDSEGQGNTSILYGEGEEAIEGVE